MNIYSPALSATADPPKRRSLVYDCFIGFARYHPFPVWDWVSIKTATWFSSLSDARSFDTWALRAEHGLLAPAQITQSISRNN
jgi:hypothetical protein